MIEKGLIMMMMVIMVIMVMMMMMMMMSGPLSLEDTNVGFPL